MKLDDVLDGAGEALLFSIGGGTASLSEAGAADCTFAGGRLISTARLPFFCLASAKIRSFSSALSMPCGSP